MRKAWLQMHFSIFLWGFTGIFGRAIDLSEGVLVWYRLLLTSACWIAIGYLTKSVKRLGRKEIAPLSFIGLLIAVHWLFFYGSIKYSNISVGMSCLAMIAVFSSILEPIILKTRFQWQELMLAIIATVGMFLIFTFHEVFQTGIILGLFSSLLASVFTVLNKKVMTQHNSETATTYELTSGFIWLTLLMPAYFFLFPTEKYLPSVNDWGLLIIFVVMCTVVPFNLSMKSLKHISAFTANLSLNMEPVYGIILAFLIYREQKDLHPGFYAGTLIILGSVVIYSLMKYQQRKRRHLLREEHAEVMDRIAE